MLLQGALGNECVLPEIKGQGKGDFFIYLNYHYTTSFLGHHFILLSK